MSRGRRNVYVPNLDRDRVLLVAVVYAQRHHGSLTIVRSGQTFFTAGHGVKPTRTLVHGGDWRRLDRMVTNGLLARDRHVAGTIYKITDDGLARLAELNKPIKRSKR